MALEHGFTSPEAGERRLRDDGLKKRGDELTQETPRAWPGQAAAAERGESSSSSIQRLGKKNGQKMRQHVGSGRALADPRRPVQADQALQAFEAEFDAPARACP